MIYDDDSEYDDDLDDEFDDFELAEDDEAARPKPGRPGKGRPAGRPSFAKPRQYGQAARGRNAGLIKTPNGDATVQLPARFPTMGEFRGTLEEIQADIKRNADGIKTLGRTNAEQDTKLSALTRSMKRSAKTTFWTSIVIGTVAIAPRLIAAINQNQNGQ